MLVDNKDTARVGYLLMIKYVELLIRAAAISHSVVW